MARRVVLLVVGAVAVGLMLAQPASAAPSGSDIEAALLTTAQVQRVTGPIDPTQDSTTPLCEYSKAIRVCSLGWFTFVGEPITSASVQVAYYPSAARAKAAFRKTKRQNTLTVETSTASTLVVSTSLDQSTIRIAAGYHLNGRVIVVVDCTTTGYTTAAEANNCTRRLLAAQTAKATPQSDSRRSRESTGGDGA